ncbi:hypothetical protein DZD18_02660 [Rhodobacteraceae bacterium W635]|nr:hypothetical protein DZD18_02660 [Rhodobacteraceae bacterium W635]
MPLSEQAAPKPPLTSNADAAEMLNVSERSVRSARKVHDSAPPEVSRAVDEGRMSVSLASKVADLPDEAKAEVIGAEPDRMRETAREAGKIRKDAESGLVQAQKQVRIVYRKVIWTSCWQLP